MSSYQPTYSPRFKLDVAGQTFQEGGEIADLVVETTVDGADRFSITLNHGFDPEHREFANLDRDRFSTGSTVQIKMGRGGDGTLTPVFEGTIHATETEFAVDRGPTVSVSGYGTLHEMMQGTNSTSWTKNTTIGKVVEEVAGSYFGTVDVSGASLTFKEPLFQDNQSDYRFVRELADTYGFDFFADLDTVHFEPRSSLARSEKPVAELTYGEELQRVTAEVNRSDQVDTVEVRYWDMTNEQEVIAESSTGSGDNREVFRIPAMSKQEAETIAETKLRQLSKGVVALRGRTDGDPAITAGETVELTEVDKRYETSYYVTKATHRMGSSGYQTTFEATEVGS